MKFPIIKQLKIRCKILYIILLGVFMFIPLHVAAQGSSRITVTGIITDTRGESIIGATVVDKSSGGSIGTITDIDGRFSIDVDPQTTLVISYIGFVTQEVPVRNQRQLSIFLNEDTHTLSEVVVVGYGVQRKVTLTGAVAAITSDEMVSTKSDNVQNMLSGKIAGVKVTQKTSEPGTFTNDFQIRGMGTPLVIVDGVPRENFTKMDANEIESISILKDAAAAIYGVRAANGVVLITTKRGAQGTAFRLDYSGYYGFQNMINQPRPLDAIGFMQLQNEKILNGGGTVLPYPQSSFEPYLNGTKQSTDWEANTMRKQAPQTQHNISATGGTDKITYFVNFGYNNQEGYWKSNDLWYDRYNLRSNISAQLAEGLRFDVYLNAMMDEKNQPSNWTTWNLFKGYWTQIPLNPLYLDDAQNYPFFAADGLHPDFMTDASKSGYQNRKQRLFQSNMSLEWDIPWISGLKVKGMYSYDYRQNDNKIFRKTFDLYTSGRDENGNETYIPSPVNSPSQLTREYFGYITDMFQVSLTYNTSVNQVHNISALLLYEESNRTADNFYARRDYSMDAVDQLFAGNSTNQVGTMNTSTSNIHNYANKGLVGRFNYDYDSKYMAEFSFRYDGSSRFAPGHQWGFFPAGSVGWRLSEEAFIKDSETLSMISNMKLRVSYGIMGDDNASSYQFLSGYNYPSNGYVLGGNYINAFGMRGIPNPYITWFTSTVLDIGLDAELWNGLLGITADVFQRDRANLLNNRSQSLPGHIGAALPQENLESDMTRGFDLTLTHRNRIGRDFSYNISGNLAFARTKWKYKEQARAGNSYLNWRENRNDRYNDVWFGWNVTGRFQSLDEIYSGQIYNDTRGNALMLPGDLVIEDWNGDGYIDTNDFYPVAITTSLNKESTDNNVKYGGGMPLLNYGFSLGAEYRDFDFNMQFQGAALSWLRYPEQLEMPLPWNRNGLDMFLDRWRRADEMDPNSTTWISGHYPSTFRDNGRSAYLTQHSTFNIENGSYLRLKSLELGYTLPRPLSVKLGMEKTRIFFNCYNLLTFTGLKYCDPEHLGEDYAYTYPLSQTFNFGVNVSF